MGATTFYNVENAETANLAFEQAKSEALYYHGHGGYSGTIAEKTHYTIASSQPLTKCKARELAESLINTSYVDKWGPAGCIEIINDSNSPNKQFLFFGWASE